MLLLIIGIVILAIIFITVGIYLTTPTPVIGAPMLNEVKYGDVLWIFNPGQGYLSPCGSTSGCGIDVTLRPDAEFHKHEPGSKLRDWTILGKSAGEPLKYGDIVQIKGSPTQWPGTELYLSPCGDADKDCGKNAALRPDVDFQQHEPNSNLRNWTVGGGPPGNIIRYNDDVTFTAMATRWPGHSGIPLSLCGIRGGCGTNVTLNPSKQHSIWKFHVLPEYFRS